jgi:Holliday junction resolvase RusA-like endonuclease
MPMPKSWSLKKKEVMNNKPHRQRPDLDNLLKALFDALCPDGDAHIWDGKVSKIWGFEGKIVIGRGEGDEKRSY